MGRSSALNAPVRKRRSKSHQLSDLLHFNALPDRLRDNEYITKYYRVIFDAATKTMLPSFYLQKPDWASR